MHLKTYTGSDLAAALRRARAELGPEALVLARREVTGRLGLRCVEITVGVERDPAPAKVDVPGSLLERLAREVERRRGRSRLPPDPRAPTVPAAPAVAQRGSERTVRRPARTMMKEKTDESTEASTAPTGGSVLDPATRALIESGLSADLVERFARIAARDLSASTAPGDVARATERGIAGLVPFEPLPPALRCLFVVGPPGCGKTTTVAKLAARMTARADRTVLFAEADMERIGSLEQATLLSRCIGARAVRVETTDELKMALDTAGPRGAVLVDTPGVGASDAERLEYLQGLRAAAPDATVAVLVPAGLHHREAAQVLRRFDSLSPSCVAFSRVDDGARLGELVTAMAPSGLPLSFLTTGHGPPDLEDASPGGLAASMLRHGLAGGAPAEVHG